VAAPAPRTRAGRLAWRTKQRQPGGIVARSGSRRPGSGRTCPPTLRRRCPPRGGGCPCCPRALRRRRSRRLRRSAQPRWAGGIEPAVPVSAVRLHPPRQVLSSIAGAEKATKDTDVFRSELAWREFYADVLFHQPESARSTFGPGLVHLRWDEGPVAEDRFRRWALGQTGVPLVDAGMRQLLAEGWVHQPGAHGGRQLPREGPAPRLALGGALVHVPARRRRPGVEPARVAVDGGDGDRRCPFHRIFNPFLQAERFDPDGAYVRRLRCGARRDGHEGPSRAGRPGGPGPARLRWREWLSRADRRPRP